MAAPKIAIVSTPKGKSIQQSENFLAAKHNQLSCLESVEDLVLDETKLSEGDRQAIEHHILNIRAATARALWSKEIYVGPSLLDEFVFSTAKQGGPGVAARVLTNLATAGAETPGFVLYPLTSFGMKMSGRFQPDPALKDYIVFRAAGFAASTQVNSVKAGYERLAEMARALGVRGKIDRWDIEHFAHSATWIRSNPLLLVRLTSHTGDMYENQFVYKLKIRSAASALLMLHALSLESHGSIDKFRSTLHVNNFQTLDIRHYLIGEGLPNGKISTRRVPMNVSPLDLVRLSDVAATISSEAMATSRMKRFETQIVAALKTVERGYFQHVNLTSKSKAQARFYKRLVTALDWFRQSFGSHANESEAVVALAVAFETLLTDSYQPGVADRMIRRVGICLKGFPRIAQYKQSVRDVYYARGSIVHTGELGQTANVANAQAAFTRCFCSIASRIASWTPTANDPMRNLLGDT
ncbi:HEPN domain-containing protein [Bradyrhizobium sp. CB3481]|uniref:HEPN domain-containing protein n=1 Tax=Bradyrhizobium sp. CB3481 TaxID=3039158 RepID=UPI0024B1B4D6|nr:HEPN domain-containing protein [Bradyrhizobium sp. CB3481]WFU14687.1 HEPN domain-containing protein [Bradyrhizobium sp. CB3481]